MKRGKSLAKVTAVLAVLALGTSCFVGGTFAKYTTSGVGRDTARVAKFGVKVTADDATMFSNQYASDTNTYKTDTVISTGAVSGVEKVVAPGTSGTLSGVSVSGKPEVAVKVSCEVTTVDLSGWAAKASEDGNLSLYFPIVFYVDDAEVTVDTTGVTTTSAYALALKTALNDALANAAQKTYPANTEFGDGADGTTKVDVPTISWKWPFEKNAANNALDTYLGDQAADSNPSTIKIGMTVTVDQID